MKGPQVSKKIRKGVRVFFFFFFFYSSKLTNFVYKLTNGFILSEQLPMLCSHFLLFNTNLTQISPENYIFIPY